MDVIINTIKKDIHKIKLLKIKATQISKISFGNLPIMVKSSSCILNNNFNVNHKKECKYDGGGYFIINGSEKVIVSQERTCANKIYCFAKKHIKYLDTVEVKSIGEKYGIVRNIQIKLTKSTGTKISCLKITFRIKIEVPLFMIFRLMSFESDKDIIIIAILV